MVHHGRSVPDLVGRTIGNGRLTITKLLGSGTNGVVFLAEGKIALDRSEKQYAVKCLPKAEKGSRHYELQHLEIRLHLTMAYHQGVIPIHSVFEEEDYLFLVLQYCPGGDLFVYMSRFSTFRGNDMLVRSVFLQLIDAVDACHNMRIFHRDLKPENILCSEDGSKVFISDFGLATEKTHSTSYGCGSSYYMSPECINPNPKREPYSTQSTDIWALGVILTSLISGHNPWHKATPTDACYNEYLKDPNFLIRMLPISEGAHKILLDIFRVDPTKRITLPALRKRIIGLDTFFATPEQIAQGNQHLQEAAFVYYSTPSQRRSHRKQHHEMKEAEAKARELQEVKGEPLSDGITAVHEVSPIMKSTEVAGAIWEVPLTSGTNSPAPEIDAREPREVALHAASRPIKQRHSYSPKFLQKLVDKLFVD